MASFRISITPSRRAAARFVNDVRAKLLKAFVDNPTISQQAVADEIGVNRSVINRQIRGRQDINLGRIAEIAWALGYEPRLSLVRHESDEGNGPHFLTRASIQNRPQDQSFWSGARTVRLPVEARVSEDRAIIDESAETA